MHMSSRKIDRNQRNLHENTAWVAVRSVFTILNAMVRTLIVLTLSTAVIGALFLGVKLIPIYNSYKKQVAGVVDQSTLETFRLQEASYIYDVNGDALAKLTGDEDSSYLAYDEIPKNAVNAFIAIEDRSFWDNSGIDVRGIMRVLVNYLKSSGDEMHGASTITQQLARNRFLTREVKLERKFKEMLIAMDLTKKYTKKQIMEFYINDINYANYYYGLEAAAKGYFGKNAKDLTLSETAYLCAIPNSPTYYNPYNHPERALTRRDKILDDMCSMGFITDSECRAAKAEEISVSRHRVPLHNYETTYAIDCAVRFLMKKDGFDFKYGFRSTDEYKKYQDHFNELYEQERNALYTGGYSIYTSLDPDLQTKLQGAVDGVLAFNDQTADNGIFSLQGAATALDNSTGKVVAIVGGRTQETSTYTLNRAFQSYRQPGSTIKPLVVYTPALENGYTSSTTVTDISIDAAKEKGVDVSTLTGNTMPLRTALEKSRNGVAWSIYSDLTPELGMAYLTQMRFDNIVPDDYYQATALGGFTHGVTTEEMAGAYSALANHGSYKEPTCIVRLVNTQGKDIFEESPSVQVYQRESADMMVDMMKGVITRGTAAAMGWNSPVQAAGKTGTTNNSKDGWFCGVTPYYAVSVWVGYDKPKALSNLYGATYPASIWKQAMTSLVEGKEGVQFEAPTSDRGLGSSEYLQGHESSFLIDNRNYTTADYRADHAKADKALKIILSLRSGEGQYGSEDRELAKNLIAQLNSESMKKRMESLLKYGTAGRDNPAETAAEVQTLPEGADPAAQGGAEGQGPASEQPQNSAPQPNRSQPQEEAAYGPAAHPVEIPVGPAAG